MPPPPFDSAAPLSLCIVTPCPRHSCKGNRITALRWAGLLRSLGHHVALEEEWSGRPADALLALHAWKSAASVDRFRAAHQTAPVVVLLAGTDLYGDVHESRVTQETLARADRVVALQPEALRELAEPVRRKTRVVRQSAAPPRTRLALAADGLDITSDRAAAVTFDVSVIGHLRDVKDPFRTALAARRLAAHSRVRVLHAGEALTDAMRDAALAEQASNPRYRWLGVLSHARSLQLLASSRLTVISSHAEGGANVLVEAIACGVPVLSSRIAGVIGTLGESYPGYFEPGDDAALARLLCRCEEEPAFLALLARWSAKLAPLVTRERERDALASLLEELFPGRARPHLRSGERLDALGVELGAEEQLPFVRLADDVARGLAAPQKRLSCCWFYDAEGSRLFEEICATPEYYVTRAEDELLADHADAIVAQAPRGATLIELGSGSAAKTRHIIEALLRRQPTVRYVMIDISPAALAASARELIARYPQLEVVAITAEYAEGLARLPLVAPGSKLVLWLGSNVGNFHRDEAAAFLGRVRAILGADDRLVVGIDLRKERVRLEPAYDDAAGVTARFNLNLLARANRELEANFDLAGFRHRALWNEEAGRVEMWLDSVRDQRVRLGLLDREITFAKGEAIHTENSYKYSPAEIAELARAGCFKVAGQWFDRARLFSESLFAPEGG